MEYRIDGVIAQTLELTMPVGETAWASKGSLVTIEEGIDWRLKVPGGAGGAVRRSLSGEGLAMTFLESSRDDARVTLGGTHPGKIILWDLASDGSVIATRGSFLAGISDVDITVTIAKRAGAAFFGGAGLFLQRMNGRGKVFIHAAGDYIERNLAEGESIRVSTGNLAAFAASCDYRIRGVGGCRKIVFGGEGVFMTELVGPGRVLMQSLERNAGQQTRSPSG